VCEIYLRPYSPRGLLVIALFCFLNILAFASMLFAF
jgi:hypothetical protein